VRFSSAVLALPFSLGGNMFTTYGFGVPVPGLPGIDLPRCAEIPNLAKTIETRCLDAQGLIRGINADGSLTPTGTAPSAPTVEAKPFYKKPVFWIAVAGSVVVVGGGAWALTRRRRKAA
jgi:hypothetical protein